MMANVFSLSKFPYTVLFTRIAGEISQDPKQVVYCSVNFLSFVVSPILIPSESSKAAFTSAFFLTLHTVLLHSFERAPLPQGALSKLQRT